MPWTQFGDFGLLVNVLIVLFCQHYTCLTSDVGNTAPVSHSAHAERFGAVTAAVQLWIPEHDEVELRVLNRPSGSGTRGGP